MSDATSDDAVASRVRQAKNSSGERTRIGSRTKERTTRLLLGGGVVAGPLFVVVAAAQVIMREGFDLRRHPLSLLSLGELGWIQIINFIASGLLSVAFAVGMRRVFASRASRNVGSIARRYFWPGFDHRRGLRHRSRPWISAWCTSGEGP